VKRFEHFESLITLVYCASGNKKFNSIIYTAILATAPNYKQYLSYNVLQIDRVRSEVIIFKLL